MERLATCVAPTKSRRAYGNPPCIREAAVHTGSRRAYGKPPCIRKPAALTGTDYPNGNRPPLDLAVGATQVASLLVEPAQFEHDAADYVGAGKAKMIGITNERGEKKEEGGCLKRFFRR